MKVLPRLSSVIALLLIGGCVLPQAHAADWSNTSLWYLHGNTFELGDRSRSIVRIEHADGWEYGDNYFFFGVMNSNMVGTTLYGEVVPRFLLSKISGRIWLSGPCRTYF
jgi:nucleoside-specific outer membrane channel protein Tsx